MTMLARHLLSQRRVVAALGQVMFDALWHARERAGTSSAVPGPEIQVRIEPPGTALIADYLTNVGGVSGGYSGTIPAHLFPHWSFGPLVQCLRSTRYPLARALNVGCRLQMNAPLSASHALDVRARLLEVRDEGGRVVLHAQVTTGQAAHPEALVADLFALVRAAVPWRTEWRNETGAREAQRARALRHSSGSAWSAVRDYALLFSRGT